MRYLIIILFAFTSFKGWAQKNTKDLITVQEPAMELHVAYNKTTLIVFPFSIKRGEAGQASIWAEVVKETDNVLRVKAARIGFDPTNLNVITSDGSVYVFNVFYSENAPCLPVYVNKKNNGPSALFTGWHLNQEQRENVGKLICQLPTSGLSIKSKDFGLSLRLEGIYLRDDLLFFKYRLRNNTHVGFNPEPFRFFIRDKHSLKRTAVQDSELLPAFVHVYGEPEEVDGQCIVAAFHKFVIADKKYLVTESAEQNGDRMIKLHLGQRAMLRAKILKQTDW